MKIIISVLILSLTAVSASADFRFTFNGHTYDVITSPKNWSDALADTNIRTVNGSVGYLVKIESAEENAIIMGALLDNIQPFEFNNTVPVDGGGQAALWIGATDSHSEGDWVWIVDNTPFWQGDSTGTAIGRRYNNWGSLEEGEPNNYGNQNYGVIALNSWIFGNEGEWDDVAEQSPLYYIIEYDILETTAAKDCAIIDSQINLTIPCIKIGEGNYQVGLSRFVNPEDTNWLYWSFSGDIQVGSGSDQCAAVDSSSNISLPCVDISGIRLEIELSYYFYALNSSALYWRLESYHEIGSASCDSSNLNLCTTDSSCSNAGGHWYDNICNLAPTLDDDNSIQTPQSAVKLIFIHHSTGGNWLADPNEDQPYGGLGRELMANNYYVSATNYGWGPYSIGDSTDIPNWPDWFTGANSSTILAAVYSENNQNIGGFGSWPRLSADPGGENEVIMFKSCFPNSDLYGNPDDEAATETNEQYTVSNAKAVYNNLLTYFASHRDKLFVVITAPPQTENEYSGGDQPPAERAANTRTFNNWLCNDWLDNYAYSNVAVFDYFNILTAADNHHRWLNDAESHEIHTLNNFAAYSVDEWDSHPSTTGHQKATEEFVPLLNYFYHRWQTSVE